MRVGGKWALSALGALVVLGVLGAGVYRWPIDPARVAAQLNSATAPVGGLHWGRPGRASFTLLPRPALRMIDVELLDAKGVSVLSAPNAEIGLWPWGLVRGEFAPVSAKLLNPTALIDLDAARDGAEQIIAKPTTLLTRIEVEGGVAKIVSADLRLDTLIENVDGWLQWTKVYRPLDFSLSGVWRGEPVALAGHVASPLELRAGRPSQAVLKITARPAELAFAGTWTPGVKGTFDGDLTTRDPLAERGRALDRRPLRPADRRPGNRTARQGRRKFRRARIERGPAGCRGTTIRRFARVFPTCRQNFGFGHPRRRHARYLRPLGPAGTDPGFLGAMEPRASHRRAQPNARPGFTSVGLAGLVAGPSDRSRRRLRAAEGPAADRSTARRYGL